MIYTVRIDFDDATLRDEFGIWLRDHHIKDVLAAGAQGAKLYVHGDTYAIDVRYTFDSREDFEAYERDHAPRLRADGIAFLAGRTARFTRTTSES
jgi:hypothetical protein